MGIVVMSIPAEWGPAGGYGARLVVAGVLSALMLASGLTSHTILSFPHDATVRAALMQVGTAGLVLTVTALPLAFVRATARRWILGIVRTGLAVAVVSGALFFATGELFLRVYYSDGQSFGSHVGPMVARFERDFQFNPFPGPSRGPAVTGPKRAGEVRVLVQGDSITWGQGVRAEQSLYTSRLLERLKAQNSQVEMAVLAKPGREIDGHVEQLVAFGKEIDPDIIIYQWFVNDMEFDKTHRPKGGGRFWRGLFFHKTLLKHSYLWFFLDYHLDVRLPAASESYESYIRRQFSEGTPGWERFATQFRVWSAEATGLTPRVMMALYPWFSEPLGFQFADIHAAIARLARAHSIAVLDLADQLRELRPDEREATPFDGHPSILVHERMAQALALRIRSLWPELLNGEAECLRSVVDRAGGCPTVGSRPAHQPPS